MIYDQAVRRMEELNSKNMASWRLRGLFANKEAITILLWYAICITVNLSVPSADFNNTVIFVVLFSSIIILNSILGLFADTFIGRYRLIQFSLWMQWIIALISAFMVALMSEYHLHNWLRTLLYSIMIIMLMLEQSSFQVVAIQFGIDQLQGAPSQLLSAFIFWYFIAEVVPEVIYQWVFYFISLAGIKPIKFDLGWSLIIAIFISVTLSVKNCFMSKWFVKEIATSEDSNPYYLIFRVLKFAKEHKYPIQRSALTYWEDEIPSRIDLGKRKYGGPFTNEEVENVKTFFQLFKVLVSLSGILITSYWTEFYYNRIYTSESESNSQLLELFTVSGRTITTGLFILCHAFSCFSKRRCLSMLKRIGIGAALTIVCVLCILLINSIKYNITSVLSKSAQCAAIFGTPMILYEVSYLMLTISLIEFLIAQSPHTMKGILIGFYYVIRFGVAGLFALIQKLYCTYVHSAVSCSEIVNNIVIAIIALLSFIMYCIVAYKYKLRERDEVINVHIFAEEYYGNHKEDSNGDYSDVDA